MRGTSLWVPFFLSSCLLVGCDEGGDGDDSTDGTTPDAAPGTPDADTTPDAGDSPDAAPPPLLVPQAVPLSPTGTDQFFGVAFHSDGSFFAGGFVGDGTDANTDRAFAVARFTAAGALDTSYGDMGVARVNVAVGGKTGEQGRQLVVQSTGKVVIAGSIEHDAAAMGTAAADRDIALVRLDTDGTPDESFGPGGVRILDLNTGIEGLNSMMQPTLLGADALWSLELLPGDKLLVHGAQRAEGVDAMMNPRSDTDYAVVRLNADGTPDTTFSGDGKFLLDIEGSNASARGAIALADGSIIGGGYANSMSLGSVQPVVYKLTSAGALDTMFGVGGVFHQIVLAAITEVYAVAEVDGKIVTAGYGRESMAGTNDWVSLRLHANGTLDTTWGDQGAVVIDPAGMDLGDNCRHITALPGGKVLLMGRAGLPMSEFDAALVVLNADGTPDTSFGPDGIRLVDLGGTNDQFWHAAVAPDGSKVVVVGQKGATGTPSASNNDDAAILVIALE